MLSRSCIRTSITALLLCSLLQACASLDPNYEEPTVTLSSFRAIPSEGMVPGFEIGLRIINPNREAIHLQGIVYTVSLQGHELVKGVGKDFEPIEAYSEGNVTLTASANLLAGIRLVGDLMGDPEESLEYSFEAKLDVGGFYPRIKISESGEFRLGDELDRSEQGE